MRQLVEGRLRFRKVGTHRRVKLTDLLDFKEKADAVSTAALDELATQAQELGLSY